MKIKMERYLSDGYFSELDGIETTFFKQIAEVEKRMQGQTGNKDVEFVFVDGEIIGIGTPSCPKKMSLIHRGYGKKEI